MIDPALPAHALLSQNVRQQFQDLRPAEDSVLDPADHHLDMFHHRLRPGGVRRRGRRVLGRGRWRCGLLCGRWECAPASGGTTLIETLLLIPPFLVLIIGDTAPRRLLLAESFTASKRTPQVLALASGHVLAPRVPRIGEKEDAAVPTADQAPTTVRLPSQQRSQDLVVLQDLMADLRPAIPVLGKLKIGRDRY
jgi:hypothetical protein